MLYRHLRHIGPLLLLRQLHTLNMNLLGEVSQSHEHTQQMIRSLLARHMQEQHSHPHVTTHTGNIRAQTATALARDGPQRPSHIYTWLYTSDAIGPTQASHEFPALNTHTHIHTYTTACI